MEDTQIYAWCRTASRYGGDFVKVIARAALYADEENFELMRPLMATLMEKYPKYLREEE